MQGSLFFLPAMVLAGAAAAQGGAANVVDPGAGVPPVEYRSAFEGYRRFAEPERENWRRANDAVRNAGGHAGRQPGKPESSGDPGGHK